MYCYYSRQDGRPIPRPVPSGAKEPRILSQPLASLPPGVQPVDESLCEILKKDSGVFDVRLGDVIYAVDEATKERRWLFYGDPDLAEQPVDSFRPLDRPFILDVQVDRDRDDLEVLSEAVWKIKGSCHYVGELERVLEAPGVIRDLRTAGIVYAVDYLTGRRCGLYFGDPAMESLPRAQPSPLDPPFVVELCLHRDNDEPEILAEAVRRIKGSCTYRPGP